MAHPTHPARHPAGIRLHFRHGAIWLAAIALEAGNGTLHDVMQVIDSQDVATNSIATIPLNESASCYQKSSGEAERHCRYRIEAGKSPVAWRDASH